MWYARIAAGTTADIVVTMTSFVESIAIATYSLYNLASQVPVSSSRDNKYISLSSPPTTLDAVVNVPQGGIVIAVNLVNPLQAVTWTGVTEDYDGGGRSSASLQELPADATYAISTTLDPGNTAALLAASWR